MIAGLFGTTRNKSELRIALISGNQLSRLLHSFLSHTVMMHSRMLKPFLYALAALGAYHTWGRTIADGTLTHLLHAMHSKDGYILPGTDSFLRTSITGIYWPIDYLLDILIVFFWEAVDGSHPTTSAIGIYFLSQFLSVFTGLYVDSLRHGQPRGTPFRYVSAPKFALRNGL